MKYLLLFILGLLIVLWLMKVRGRRNERPAARPPAGSEDMVRCEHCGVHLPRSESITTQGSFYCTPEHRRLHRDS